MLPPPPTQSPAFLGLSNPAETRDAVGVRTVGSSQIQARAAHAWGTLVVADRDAALKRLPCEWLGARQLDAGRKVVSANGVTSPGRCVGPGATRRPSGSLGPRTTTGRPISLPPFSLPPLASFPVRVRVVDGGGDRHPVVVGVVAVVDRDRDCVWPKGAPGEVCFRDVDSGGYRSRVGSRSRRVRRRAHESTPLFPRDPTRDQLYTHHAPRAYRTPGAQAARSELALRADRRQGRLANLRATAFRARERLCARIDVIGPRVALAGW